MEEISLIKDLTEEKLLRIYRETGDNRYGGELFRRYSHLVLGVCLKYLKDEEESKDMVIKIFEKLLVELLRTETTFFKSWLYSLCKNECLMHLRVMKREAEKLEEVKKDFSVFMETSYVLHLNNESEKENLLNSLEKGVKGLNKEQQVCVELFYLKEKSYSEVSEITGYSMNEVKSHIQNGKRNLKIFLMNQNE